MLTIIAFIITILGSINWLTIGLLQYDFIAGVFGFQASIFSRIIYIIFGIACAFLVFKLFKGKGTLAVFSRRNKKDLAKNLEKIGISDKDKKEIEAIHAQPNIESAEEYLKRDKYDSFEKPSPSRHTSDYDFSRERIEHSSSGRSLFDEHFNDRGE